MVMLMILICNSLGGMRGRRIINGSAQTELALLALSLWVVYWLGVSVGNEAWGIAIGGILIGRGIYALADWRRYRTEKARDLETIYTEGIIQQRPQLMAQTFI